jgi:hypothetical protein
VQVGWVEHVPTAAFWSGETAGGRDVLPWYGMRVGVL